MEMEPEKATPAEPANGSVEGLPGAERAVVAPAARDLHWVFLGPEGLRAGWSVGLFLVLLAFCVLMLGTGISMVVAATAHGRVSGGIDPVLSPVDKAAEVASLLFAAWVVSKVEKRRLTDYYLRGPRPVVNFAGGLAAGFVALSVLVGALTLGGWMHFGPVALSGGRIALYGAIWAVGFLLVGCSEEGLFRCYLQFTLTRGINFWWALGVVGLVCIDLLLRAKGNGVWGVYLMALLGLAPCLWLFVNKTPRSGFWNASWVTSTLFGFVHTGNNGENWIGIFAAGAIGFVFCVSVYVTGSAWWAIGCHASWDWAETYFYGTADSGLVAKGHLLTTTPVGNPLWSGGTDGPEGSLLVLGVILLLLIAVVALYGRRREAGVASAVAQQAAG